MLYEEHDKQTALKAYAVYTYWIHKPYSHICNMLHSELIGIAALYINSQVLNLGFYLHCISSFDIHVCHQQNLLKDSKIFKSILLLNDA